MGFVSYFSISVGVFFSMTLTQVAQKAQAAEPYFPQSPQAAEERIIGENNLEPIENADGTFYYDMAKSVARVEMGSGYCTGFRIGEDLMMTNHHCLASCSSMKFRFGYERNMSRDQQTIFKCTSVVAKDSTLDFSIIRVALESGANADLIPVVSLDRRPLSVDRMLFVTGHPQARMKEMDRSDNCKVVALPTNSNHNLTHTCDTEGGNSGSSVFDRETGHVVGLHWGYNDLNQATWMNRIISKLEQTNPSLIDELTVIAD